MVETLRLSTQNLRAVYSDTNNSKLRSSLQNVRVLYSDNVSKIRLSLSNVNVVYAPYYNAVSPIADISNSGNWTPEPIFDVIDEEDGTCVASELTPTSSTFEVALEGITNFDVNNDLHVAYRFLKEDVSGVPQDDGDTINITVYLYEKNTLINSWTHNDIVSNEGKIIQRVDATGKGKIGKPDELSIRVLADTSVVAGSGLERRAAFCFVETLSTETGVVSPPPESEVGSGLPVYGAVNESYSGFVHGAMIINYPNVGGEKEIGWDSRSSIFAISGTIDSINTRYTERFRDQRYYKGDN